MLAVLASSRLRGAAKITCMPDTREGHVTLTREVVADLLLQVHGWVFPVREAVSFLVSCTLSRCVGNT